MPKRFDLRLPEELHKQLLELAKNEKRSLHSQIIYILQQWLIDKQQLKQKEGKK